MSEHFETAMPPPRRVEFKENPDGSIFVVIPPEISDEWAEEFTENFGQEEFETTVNVEDWLVQRPDEDGPAPISSAYFRLEDQQNFRSKNWRQTIKGRVWDAGLAPTPQYVDDPVSPVLALVDAKIVQAKKEELIPDIPGRLVLVRLDRIPAGITLKRVPDSTRPRAA